MEEKLFTITEKIEEKIVGIEAKEAIHLLIAEYKLNKNLAEASYRAWREEYRYREPRETTFEYKPIRGYRKWKISEKVRKRMIEKRKSGKSILQIAKEEKINKDKVYKELKGVYPDSWNGKTRIGRKHE